MPPRSFRFDLTNVSPDPAKPVEHHVLRFTNTVWNAGPGRLDLQGTVGASGNADAYQHLFDATGADVLNQKVGLFFFHQQHNHYHFDNWGKYQLWTKAAWDAWVAAGRTGAQPAAVGQKTTSCALDEEFVTTLPGTPGGPNYRWAGCMPDANKVIHEGISPGWGDTYDYYRFEQWIDLDSVPGLGDGTHPLKDGDYVLRSVFDPTNKVLESPGKGDPARESEQANEGVAAFTVSNGQVLDTQPPTGSIYVNGVAAATDASVVTVRVVGRDDVSDMDQIRLSNDGVHWVTAAYHADPAAPSSPIAYQWDLADPQGGGSPFGGLRTVFVQFHDTSGKWGPSASDTITLRRPGAATLTVTKTGAGAGIVTSSPTGLWCPTACTGSFFQGSAVTLTAVPATGSTFGGWSGACTGTGACTVTLSANAAVGAAFNRRVLGAPAPRRLLAAPRRLRAVVRVVHGRRRVVLLWSAAKTARVRFTIQRSTDGGRHWRTITRPLSRKARSYTDARVRRRARYAYRVRAFGGGRVSAWRVARVRVR